MPRPSLSRARTCSRPAIGAAVAAVLGVGLLAAPVPAALAERGLTLPAHQRDARGDVEPTRGAEEERDRSLLPGSSVDVLGTQYRVDRATGTLVVRHRLRDVRPRRAAGDVTTFQEVRTTVAGPGRRVVLATWVGRRGRPSLHATSTEYDFYPGVACERWRPRPGTVDLRASTVTHRVPLACFGTTRLRVGAVARVVVAIDPADERRVWVDDVPRRVVRLR